MGVVLESNVAKATINQHGAELSSFVLKDTNQEYIWQADPKHWGRHAPVLFPIVGRLKNDEYSYNGRNYNMTQHGFARDMEFSLVMKTQEEALFLLTSTSETKEMYPFEFSLFIRYTLRGTELSVTYIVETESDEMYFSIGGHPAFNVPLSEKVKFEDYFIKFSPSKSRVAIPLEGYLIKPEMKTIAQTNTSIKMSREWFKNDAHIFETSGENSFTIASELDDASIELSYDNFPYVGFWSAYPSEAPFICIEPWCGIADDVDSSGDITKKYGINHITKDEVFTRTYKIKIK